MTAAGDLEVRCRPLFIGGVVLFSAALAMGLALHVLVPGRLSSALLQTGLVLLMAAPALRIGIAVAERIRRRDWMFVVMTAIVAIELAVVMWRAAAKS